MQSIKIHKPINITMMKSDSLIKTMVAAAAMTLTIVSCSTDESDILERTETYTVATQNGGQQTSRQADAAGYLTCRVRVGCNIQSTVPTIPVDPAAVKVTVKSVLLRVVSDDTVEELMPVVAPEVAEPQSARRWSSLPSGLSTQTNDILTAPLDIRFKNRFSVQAFVTCTVRVKDDQLYKGYTEFSETLSYSCSSADMSAAETQLNGTLYLQPVQFSADVEAYS